MNIIKSEKAKEYLDENGYTMYGEPVICLISATKAIIIAETEAEERHAKELQELKDKAVEAFREFVEYYTAEAGYPEIHQGAEHYIKIFTQKLNEK